ncbi:sporulation histidine kinase inhibitor Sda [Bacillus sp. EB600]|nr:sporulation histidine kinase inhibitor Sda [Bacillus sp. EB600]
MLQDNLLIKAYKSAVQLKLSSDFITLLTDEIEKRNLFIIDLA